jgi:hypothetical protein
MCKLQTFWVGFAVTFALHGVGRAALVENFESIPSDPVWQSGDNGWEFLDNSLNNGTVGTLYSGTVLSGGPSGKYGHFEGGAGDNTGVTHALEADPIVGHFKFDTIFNDDATVGAIGQQRFWLGTHRGDRQGVVLGYQRPFLYFNKSGTPGKVQLQTYRGPTLSWLNDNSSLNLNQWYKIDIGYDLNVATWTLKIQDLNNNVVFDEHANYEINVAGVQALNYATWEVRYGPSGTGKSLPWNVDNIQAIPPATAHPGDFDGDGDVDGADFVAWQTNFPKQSGATLAQGDADADGDVDGADFVVWQTNFPFTPGPAISTVPEPNSIQLLAVATGVVLWSLRRCVRRLAI